MHVSRYVWSMYMQCLHAVCTYVSSLLCRACNERGMHLRGSHGCRATDALAPHTLLYLYLTVKNYL